MDIDYKELERVAGLTDLVDPDLGNTLQQLFTDLRTKNDAYNEHCKSKPKAGPTYNKLGTDLEVTVSAILTFFRTYSYAPCNMSSGMWGKAYVMVHPLYV